jgi:hypothetical protein
MNFNLQEILKRLIKYLVEGLIVAIACVAIPQKSLKLDEIVMLGLVAAATFSILDTFIPTMGQSARQGAGLGIGFGISGFGKGF